MHFKNILHRDIKAENLLLSNVDFIYFNLRMLSSFVTLGGRLNIITGHAILFVEL